MSKEKIFSDLHSIITINFVKRFFIEMMNNLHDDDHFLELSREREKDYAMRSAERWLDILTILAGKKRDISNMTVLDVGTSPFTFLLRELSASVTTIDLTNHLKERCERVAIEFYEGGIPDSLYLLPDNHFDCIICLEVLEHLHTNPVKVLEGLHKKLKNRGFLILSTPNLACLDNRIKLALNKKLNQFTYPPFADNTHIVHGHMHDRIYMPPELLDYANMAGFSRSTLKYYMQNSSYSIMEYFNPRKMIGLLLRQIFPSFRTTIILIAEK